MQEEEKTWDESLKGHMDIETAQTSSLWSSEEGFFGLYKVNSAPPGLPTPK